MHIYKAEQQDNLTELLSAKSSFVYASLLEKSDSEISHTKARLENQSLAGIEDTDLYYTQSILVTTSWNKNDDIFDAREVWLARSTPTHKPTNLEHDEKTIVGHITSNWPIDEDGNIIDESLSLEELPQRFHILTGSVIYKGFTEPELRDRANNLISEIESGEKYVSMECFFKNFDYGLINKSNGQFHVLSRNDDTAFLTKYLRAYGGLGEHENYKIGRVLREITFSGKGFVNKPANPDSIIFTKDNLPMNKEQASIKNLLEKNVNFEIKGVFSNQANLKETSMSVESTVSTEEVTTVTEPEVTSVAPSVDTQEAEAAKKMKEDMTKKEEEMKKMQAALEATQAELQAANEVLAGYKMKEEEMAKKEKKMKRMATLVESGVSEEVANATVDQFESMDDTAFESIAALVAAVKPPKKDKEEPKEVTKAEETTVKAEDVSLALENVETNDQEIDLSVGSETESEMQNTRAALVDFVCIRLGKKLNKGE